MTAEEEFLMAMNNEENFLVIKSNSSNIRYEFRRGKHFTSVNMYDSTTDNNFDYRTWENGERPFEEVALVKWIREYETETSSESK